MPRGRPPSNHAATTGTKADAITLSGVGVDEEVVMQETDDWLTGFTTFTPQRAPLVRGKERTVTISPRSGKMTLSPDLGQGLTFGSDDGKGWVTLHYNSAVHQIAIVGEHGQEANTIRIVRTKGQRYTVNTRAFLVSLDLMPTQRITLDAEWRESGRVGALITLPY